MNVTTKKEEFVDRMKGKPIPRDMFGQSISLGDWFVWGGGAKNASSLNFGRVTKINYNKEKYSQKAETRVSSISVVKMSKASFWDERERGDEIINGFIRGIKKVAVGNYHTGMVVDGPPNKIAEQILGDVEVPKE